MKETLKSKIYREQKNHFDLYLNGHGIDIGSGDDVLEIKNGIVDEWDLYHGDAQYMIGVPNEKYDFVYSSHCLEHMYDVDRTLMNWIRILKPNGYLYITVPDYILYEKLRFPSIYNTDHKNSFSVFLTKEKVKRDNHYHSNDIAKIFEKFNCQTISIELEDENFDYSIGPDIDQTRGNAQAQILFIAQKL